MSTASDLKQKLLAALQSEVQRTRTAQNPVPSEEQPAVTLQPGEHWLQNGQSVYGLLTEEESAEPLSPSLQETQVRLKAELRALAQQTRPGAKALTASSQAPSHGPSAQKKDFNDTLSMRGVVPKAQTENVHPAGVPSSSSQVSQVKSESVISGGSMADLSGYKDLSKAPLSFGDEEMPVSSLPSAETGLERGAGVMATPPAFQQELPQEVDTEFSGNVKTLIRLVNELPEGVTKQTGAQIIRLTMEAMGISMEDVLSEAQSAQSEMLDAVRANIKKIEEYKTVIRKLETDIKYYQGKANELSEIIDLFILSNTSGQRVPSTDELSS